MTALDRSSVTCTLVSRSCTTGWSDWVHGELWLCPDGLFRKSRGWGSTIAGSLGSSTAVDAKDRPTRLIGDLERANAAAVDKRNWWIPWELVATAKLQSGPMSHSLHFQLTDGRKLSLRWLRADGPTYFLRSALEEALGGRLLPAG